MKKLILACAVLLTAAGLQAQSLDYNIVKGEDTLGGIEMKKWVVDDSTFITIESNIEFKFIWKVELTYFLTNHFVHDKLVHSYSENFVNGKQSHGVRTTWDGEKYIVEDNDKKKEQVLNIEQVEYTFASIYFEEPTTRKRVFSERYYDYMPVELMEDGRYKLNLSSLSKNNVTFANGLCQEVEVKHPLAKFYFRLTNAEEDVALTKR